MMIPEAMFAFWKAEKTIRLYITYMNHMYTSIIYNIEGVPKVETIFWYFGMHRSIRAYVCMYA